MEVNINGNLINVNITRKISNKNTYLRVKEDLNLYVTTNTFVSDKEIKKIIVENEKSILNMLSKQQNKNEINSKFMYLGKVYDVILVNNKNVEFGNNKVFIGKDIDIDKYLKKQAQTIFLERLNYWYQNFDRKIPYPKLRIRKMTSRWGVCNFKDNVVTLNLELMKKDISCLDYVIVHELSHFIEHNHSSSFWKVVGDNYPNYKEVRRQMKNY